MSSNKAALDSSSLFKDTTSLSMKPLPKDEAEATPSSSSDRMFGPGSDGVTYELCAGIVDKQIPLEQIAREEVLEETG